MKNDALDQKLRETLSGTAPAEIHERTERHFQALAAHVRQQESKLLQRESRHPASWWLWPGVSIAGAAAIAMVLFTIFVSPSVSWAQVVERFRALPYFAVTVYVSQNPEQPPEKIELWAAHDHRTRVHYRGLIFFGQADKGVRVLRAESGQEIPLEELNGKRGDEEFRKNFPAIDVALGVHESLRQMPNFSLDELLRTFSGKREDLQPVPNVDASIAVDMQVFDLVTKQSPEWIRLWVLKKSELPVRIRSINPSFGNQIEAIFDYFTAMPDEAFDPAKVQSAIRAKQGSANRLYALLKDPGGRPLTPEDLFAKAGLHLPQLATVGRTAEGVVWVQSHKGENRSADGRRFDGWGKLRDNLGQEYLRVWAGQRLEGDIHEEYFIPLNYGAGYQKPASYTLTCWDREDDYSHSYWRDRPTTIVGSVEVKQWTEGASVPKLFDDQLGLDNAGFTRRLLSHLASLEEWERFDALAATIPGAPEDNSLALFRDMKLTEKLDKIRQYEQAAAVRARLFPLVKVEHRAPDEWELIESHLSDLVRAGQREAARPLANRFVTDLPVQREIHIGRFIYKLHEAGMSLDDIRKFFDEDVLNLPRVKEDLGRMSAFHDEIQNSSNDPRYAAWREYVEKLAARYRDQAPSAECEFIESDFVAPSGQAGGLLPLPGHPGYSVGIWAPVPPQTLRYSAAAYRKLDPSLITVSPNVKETKAAICVYRTTTNSTDTWEAYLKFQGINTVEKSTTRTVLVAQYNGQILPNCFQVTPLNCSQFGTTLVRDSGGMQNNTTNVLENFAEAMNFGLVENDPRRTIILNETGLPDEPGANQSAANVCLVYDTAFWAGPEATLMATDWFRNNFGITFHKEERALKTLELQPAD